MADHTVDELSRALADDLRDHAAIFQAEGRNLLDDVRRIAAVEEAARGPEAGRAMLRLKRARSGLLHVLADHRLLQRRNIAVGLQTHNTIEFDIEFVSAGHDAIAQALRGDLHSTVMERLTSVVSHLSSYCEAQTSRPELERFKN